MGEDLIQLIKLCEGFEWERVIADIANKLKGDLLKQILEKLKEVKPSPRNYPGSETPEILNDTEKTYYENLMKQRKTIISMQTIFVLPFIEKEDYAPYQRFIENTEVGINNELNKFRPDEDGMLLNCFSFAIESNNSNEKMINPLDKLVDKLLLNLNKGTFDKLKPHLQKEGPVLLEGPTGVGKTMFANLFAKNYKEGKFYSENLSGIPPEHLESRIRGIEKEAFTGVKEQEGFFEKANNGVLFLDEFHSVKRWAQTQLLTIVDPLSNKATVPRLGKERTDEKSAKGAKGGEVKEDAKKVFNVKEFFAVNESVEYLLKKNRLRKDLRYRIRQIVPLPSLKEILNEKAIKERGGLTPKDYIWKLIYIYRWKHPLQVKEDNIGKILFKAFPYFGKQQELLIESFLKRDWEGNFREFEIVIADILWEIDHKDDADLTQFIKVQEFQNNNNDVSSKNAPKEMNNINIVQIIEDALKKNNYNYKQTYEDLQDRGFGFGIGSAPTLRKKLKEHYKDFSEETKKELERKKLIGTIK